MENSKTIPSPSQAKVDMENTIPALCNLPGQGWWMLLRVFGMNIDANVDGNTGDNVEVRLPPVTTITFLYQIFFYDFNDYYLCNRVSATRSLPSRKVHRPGADPELFLGGGANP